MKYILVQEIPHSQGAPLGLLRPINAPEFDTYEAACQWAKDSNLNISFSVLERSE